MPAEAACVERIRLHFSAHGKKRRMLRATRPNQEWTESRRDHQQPSFIRAQKHGWHGLVEEYHADAALRRKEDLAKGQPEPIKRTLGGPASQQDLLPQCKNDAAYVCRILLDSSSHSA